MTSEDLPSDHRLLLRWKRWEEIHSMVCASSIWTLIQLDLQSLFKETLAANSIVADGRKCGQDPSICEHCHQLTALSAVTMFGSLLKMREDVTTTGECVSPLLESDILQLMVDLFQHPCKFIRYQSRRTLATLLSLNTSTVQRVLPIAVKLCVNAIQLSKNSVSSHQESLQLLCSLMSQRVSGHSINTQCLAMLQPHLPELLAQCKLGQRSTSQPLSVGRRNTDLYSAVSLPGTHNPFALSFGDCSALSGIASQDSSDYPGGSLYLFLCLIQKITKLINILEIPHRPSKMKVLYKSVLSELTDDLLSALKCNQNNSGCDLLLIRKSLDVIDTVLAYDSSVGSDVENKDIVHQILYGLDCDKCYRQLMPQRIFVGGRWCDGKGERMDTDCEEQFGSAGYVTSDSGCNPALVLLLAVTLKSCAISFKAVNTQYSTDEMKELESVCTSVVISVHTAMRRLFQPELRRPSAEASHCEVEDKVDWLPLVCGDQDDRWLEALLCLLDIYIQAKMIPDDRLDGQRQTLLTLLDPHCLFIQLLTLTHFDALLIIDWLTSPETCCLCYLTRYLRLLTSDFPALVHTAQTWKEPTAAVLSKLQYGRQESAVSQQVDADVEDTQDKEEEKDSAQKEQAVVTSVCLTPSSADAVQSKAQSSGLALLSAYGDATDNDSSGDDMDDDADEEGVGKGPLGSVFICHQKELKVFVSSYDSEADTENNDYDDVEDDDDDNTDENKESVGEHPMFGTEKSVEANAGMGLGARDETDGDSKTDILDRVMCLLMEVRRKLERLCLTGLIAYNPRPLITLLRKCEHLFKEHEAI